jgi:hypothetical protein
MLGIKLTIWLPTIKSQESPRFPCVHVFCNILLKALDEGYNFVSYLISIEGLHAKLWAPKVAGIPVVEILGLPLGSFKTKWHLGAGPVARHRVYYKGEGGGFPQVWAVMSLVSLCLPMACACTKMLQLCIN